MRYGRYRGSVYAFISRTGVLCEHLEKGMPFRRSVIRQQAREIDDLWDRLSHAYARVRRESPTEMIQEEMEALRAMLEERRRSELRKLG